MGVTGEILRKNRALGAGIAVRRPGDRLFRCRWEGFRKSAGTEADQHPKRTVVLFGNHGFIKIGGDLFSAHFSNPHLPIVRRLGIGIAASGPAADAEEPAAVAQAHWAAAEEARGDAAEFAPGQDSASGSSQTITRS